MAGGGPGALDRPGAPELRAAAGDDVDDVLELWRRDGGAPGATDTPESLRGLLAAAPGALLLAADGAELVGSVIAAWDGWRGSLYRLVVREDRRRAGIGRALVAAAERRLHVVGARRITALVDVDDAGARAFWEAVGYVHQPERARYLKSPAR